MQRPYMTAREAGIDHLYHFAAFDMARLYPIVAFNRLYFARPQGFGSMKPMRMDLPRYDWQTCADQASQHRLAP